MAEIGERSMAGRDDPALSGLFHRAGRVGVHGPRGGHHLHPCFEPRPVRETAGSVRRHGEPAA